MCKQQPKNIHPLFFSTKVFGSLCELSFSSVTQQIPKITKTGKRPADLDSETAHPEDWPTLMTLVDELSDICLKPCSKSASSDAFLIAGAKLKKELVKVTVGLAVKNFHSKKISSKDLEMECYLFNRMFDGIDCHKRKKHIIYLLY